MISVGKGPVLWGVDFGNNVWFKQVKSVTLEDPGKDWEKVPSKYKFV